jgi:hypothetical protein
VGNKRRTPLIRSNNLFTAIIGGFLGHVAARAREKKALKNKGLKGLDPASLSMHQVLGDKLESGWRLKKP